jgi:cell fate regulator YaaT (PSP1 superfamily)
MHRVNRNNTSTSAGTGATDSRESYTLPDGYKVPHVALEPHERTINADRNVSMPFAGGRPRKMLYIVSFKCSRVGVFYLLDNTGLVVAEGDMVIVEADRGQDLGVVQHACVTQEEARTLLAKYGEEQYKWLMMFSQNNQAGAVNPNAAVYGEVNGGGHLNQPSTRPPRDAYQNLKPKAIKRMAAPHEIRMLMDKEGNEAKAKRACQQKVYQHHLDMEILEAEFQW